MVIDQIDLLKNRRSTLREVFSFLSVNEALDSPEFDEELNKSSERRTYPPGLARFVGRTVRPRLRWLPRSTRRFLRQSAERILLPPLETSELDDQLRSRLQELYADDVKRLRVLTGKSFPEWDI